MCPIPTNKVLFLKTFHLISGEGSPLFCGDFDAVCGVLCCCCLRNNVSSI